MLKISKNKFSSEKLYFIRRKICYNENIWNRSKIKIDYNDDKAKNTGLKWCEVRIVLCPPKKTSVDTTKSGAINYRLPSSGGAECMYTTSRVNCCFLRTKKPSHIISFLSSGEPTITRLKCLRYLRSFKKFFLES